MTHSRAQSAMPDLPAARLLLDHPLAPHFSLRLGGSARAFLRVESEPELRAALEHAERTQLPTLVLGGGSNIVCADAGFDGLVIQIGLLGVDWQPAGGAVVRVHVAAGELWDDLVARCCERGLQGLECLSGIPGTVGAAPIQNIGAYGQEVSETIREVRCIDRQTRETVEFLGSECEFAYRASRFKGRDRERFAIVRVTFELATGQPPRVTYPGLLAALPNHDSKIAPSLEEVREAVLRTRRDKSMLLTEGDPNGRNCGSFFLNPFLTEAQYQALVERTGTPPPRYPAPPGYAKVPAAWLIERAGFTRGQRSGNVGISTKHSLCLVAHDGATSGELLAFARAISARVEQQLGVPLVPEPNLVGIGW